MNVAVVYMFVRNLCFLENTEAKLQDSEYMKGVRNRLKKLNSFHD
ncbi:hypothetical protein CAEBREN_01240 [Caenorhabditis brenneri]|uniref:Uncharacterized protein n=1 Tax=Caenorhabditis brenneri TaxID=135651 RepID=G0MJC7_CAEBE|nr:hypothetical protein CAEBREN_01240 [Caenorhabditis brenneri]